MYIGNLFGVPQLATLWGAPRNPFKIGGSLTTVEAGCLMKYPVVFLQEFRFFKSSSSNTLVEVFWRHLTEPKTD